MGQIPPAWTTSSTPMLTGEEIIWNKLGVGYNAEFACVMVRLNHSRETNLAHQRSRGLSEPDPVTVRADHVALGHLGRCLRQLVEERWSEGKEIDYSGRPARRRR